MKMYYRNDPRPRPRPLPLLPCQSLGEVGPAPNFTQLICI